MAPQPPQLPQPPQPSPAAPPTPLASTAGGSRPSAPAAKWLRVLVAIAVALMAGVGVARVWRAFTGNTTGGSAIGETHVLRDASGAQAEVTVTAAAIRATGCEPRGRPALYVVDVTITATTGSWTVDPHDFSYLQAKGDGSVTVGIPVAPLDLGGRSVVDVGCPTRLAPRSLASGQSVSGHVDFPNEPTSGEIIYGPDTAADPVSWEIGRS